MSDEIEDVTATDVFKFVNDLFAEDSISNESLQYAIIVIMASVDENDPRTIVRQFGIVVEEYQNYCLSRIRSIMSGDRSKAIADLHNASIIAQGGT